MGLASEPHQPTFKDLVKPTMTPTDLQGIVGQFLTPQAKQIFGEDPAAKATAAILFTTPLAPSPATFSRKAYELMLGYGNVSTSPEQLDATIDLCKSIGLFTERDGGRFEITDSNLHETLKAIGKQVQK